MNKMLAYANKLESKYNLRSNALSGSVEAWHCGQDLKGGHFSINFLGTGEGINYLGPGIYFTNDRKIAEGYAKYSKSPYLYHVSLITDNLYDPVYGEPLHLREKAIQLQEKIRVDFGLPAGKSLDPTSSFKYGKWFMGFLNQNLGPIKAIQAMKAFGIDGIYEKLPSGAIEYCMYDLSSIKILNKEALTENQ